MIGIGSFGTSLTTSFVTVRVPPLPPLIQISPPLDDPEDEDDDEDFFAAAPVMSPPFSPREEPPELEDLDEELDELDPSFDSPKTKNSTARITTAARVTKTIIAVNRMARGML